MHAHTTCAVGDASGQSAASHIFFLFVGHFFPLHFMMLRYARSKIIPAPGTRPSLLAALETFHQFLWISTLFCLKQQQRASLSLDQSFASGVQLTFFGCFP